MDYNGKRYPETDKVAGSYGFPQMVAFDFGVCMNKKELWNHNFIEMQGFPSLLRFPGNLSRHH
jgi:hypothetical protein